MKKCVQAPAIIAAIVLAFLVLLVGVYFLFTSKEKVLELFEPLVKMLYSFFEKITPFK